LLVGLKKILYRSRGADILVLHNTIRENRKCNIKFDELVKSHEFNYRWLSKETFEKCSILITRKAKILTTGIH